MVVQTDKRQRYSSCTLNVLVALLIATYCAASDTRDAFRFGPSSSPTPPAASSSSSSASATPLVWQPLPLRATFRPLNRQSSSSDSGGTTTTTIATSSAPPQPPPEPLALVAASSGDSSNDFAAAAALSRSSVRPAPVGGDATASLGPQPLVSVQPAAVSSTTTARPTPISSAELDEDAPTRQPLSRFRPTRAPSNEEDEDFSSSSLGAPTGGATDFNATSTTLLTAATTTGGVSSECFECICEASTSCNAQSRCQTSDVRHTRCGMFLISYDQWLATGLSRELVTREALARDPAADERAFYECVTSRECAERLLAIYMQQNRKDCDKDTRIDCYDLAAIHHSGREQCASEALLDSQYWSDFNACFGFGRRRRRR